MAKQVLDAGRHFCSLSDVCGDVQKTEMQPLVLIQNPGPDRSGQGHRDAESIFGGSRVGCAPFFLFLFSFLF